MTYDHRYISDEVERRLNEEQYHYTITARAADEQNQTWQLSFAEPKTSYQLEEMALRLLFAAWVPDYENKHGEKPEFEDFEGYVDAITESVGHWSDVTIMYNEWGHAEGKNDDTIREHIHVRRFGGSSVHDLMERLTQSGAKPKSEAGS